MASDKPVSGPEPQPAGLIPVGASSTGGASAPAPALAAVVGGGGGGGGSSSSSAAVMGELRASGSGSVVLPAGMINPSVPIRNIRMKFAVLIGLIQVGEVSNRDIVETVLNLVRGLHPTSKQGHEQPFHPFPTEGRESAAPRQSSFGFALPCLARARVSKLWNSLTPLLSSKCSVIFYPTFPPLPSFLILTNPPPAHRRGEELGGPELLGGLPRESFIFPWSTEGFCRFTGLLCP